MNFDLNKNKKTVFRLLLLPFLLYSFVLAGLPIELILLFGLFFLLVILFRSKAYNKIELFLAKKFPVIHSWHPWAKKALIVIVFIAVYTLIKSVLFFSIDFVFGVNINQLMAETAFASLK